MYDIIIGRGEADLKQFGNKGCILLGKHYIQMRGSVSLSNNVYLDMVRSHVVFICGKRGSGKSYTMGAIAEGMAEMPEEVKQNLSIVMFDTMGIYWTMKYPNKRDETLLGQWGMHSKAFDVSIFTPTGFYEDFRNRGIPTDHPFSIRPSELDASDWCITFAIEQTSPIGVVLERVIETLKDSRENYSVQDIIRAIQADERSEQKHRDAAENRFLNADRWGVFSDKGTGIREIAVPGKVSVIDCSCYATAENGWQIKSMVIGLISRKLFMDRMVVRRAEEFATVHEATHYFGQEERLEKKEVPLVWLVLDEAHEFLPNRGKTAATDALITILREGRQPGISLVLATQQPGKIHTDVMTQADTVISHRITAKIDTDALGALMQSYMRHGLDVEIDNLPRESGAALIFDDMNEKLYPIRVRPRMTWHGGSSPIALQEKKKLFEF